MPVEVLRLTLDNFGAEALDGFIRRQEVTECWRHADGVWRLLPIAFTDDWDAGRRREKAAEMRQAIASGIPAFGAFDGDRLVGFALLGERLGSRRQYFELDSFHVSAPYRGQGIGRRLFAAVSDAAREAGADKLYISAHSARESQAAYRALGCVHAAEIDPVRVEREPCDVQMEFDLRPLTVRFGRESDITSWMALVRRVAWNFPGLETEAALQEHAAAVTKFIRKGNAVCAVRGDEVVGVLLFSRRLNRLCCMAVAPEARRQGIARRMFSLMLTIADPARDMTVTTFREGDPRAEAPRAFYLGNGFVPAELVDENQVPCQVFVRKANQ